MDKEAQEKIGEKLDEIRALVSEIRDDWTDPRYECREIWRVIGEIREVLTDCFELPKDRPPLLSDKGNNPYSIDRGGYYEPEKARAFREGVRAQWDICVKHYEEGI